MGTKRSRLGADPLSWILEDEGSSRTGPLPRPRPVDSSQTDILEIRDRPLSQVVGNYLSCPVCCTVVRDTDGEERADCPCCENKLTGGTFFFKRPVHSLVDLIQTAFHLGRTVTQDNPPLGAVSGFDQTVACLLFFTRLGDVTLDQLLRAILRSQHLPPHIGKRLLTDHPDYRSRIGKLFPTLTGETWRASIETLASERGLEYVETVVFRQRASTMTDAFLQLGELPENGHEIGATCVLRIVPLLDLHAALHNRFVLRRPRDDRA
jgi:hypothetical protein